MKSFSGNIFHDGKLQHLTMHVDGGHIVKFGEPLEDHTDFGDAWILPGGIDVHVHFRDPGATHKESIRSGSISAAMGGVTAFVDMPNTLPPTTTLKAVLEKQELMQQSVVDWGMWAGGTWYTQELPEMFKHCVGVKTYLGATTGDLLLEDDKAFMQILDHAGVAGVPVALHCEAQRVLRRNARNEENLVDHDVCRPPMAEVEAIYDVMKVLPRVKHKPRIHIAHAASKEAVQAASTAGFSLGVCPHHMFLDTSLDIEPASFGKMNPPLRNAASREALFDAFNRGLVPIIESDHAPHTKAEKLELFHKAPSGVPGVETLIGLLLAKVVRGDVSLAHVVEATSTNPALLLGLSNRGVLDIGMRADFAVYPANGVKPLTAADLHSACGWTPYEGMDCLLPQHTYLRGEAVVTDRKLVNESLAQPLKTAS